MNKLANKTKEELLTLLNEKREALRKFRFGISGSKAKNVKEGLILRRDIARILTFLNIINKN
jgi:ribosomal protein L29